MAKNALTESEILSRIEQEEANGYGINDAQLSFERAQAINYYLGLPFGNEVEGRSQVVSTDVADVVESMLPSLLKVFVSGDRVVEFMPVSPEDIEGAEQETEAVNHIVMEKNNGFQLFYVWFKDALMSKTGYVKVYWDEYEEVDKETYRGQTDEELAMILQGDVEVLEHSAYIGDMASAMAGQPITLHDVRVQTKKTNGCVRIKNCAPESIIVSVDTPSICLSEAQFIQHREMMTIGELRADGFDVPDDISSDANSDQNEQEQIARDIYDESANDLSDERLGADRKVLVRDTYMRVNGELMRYVVVGTTILHEEEAEVIPFAAISPILMPHRHVGRSIADQTMDIQLIKSTLIRAQLDGMYLSLNPRYGVSDRVNLDDMLVSRPGGVVRMVGDTTGAIQPLVSPDVSGAAYPMTQYMDSVRENRTGITKYNQGMDADSLNKTATGVNRIMDAAAQRQELIARTFAETGVKELFQLVHRLTKTYSQREMIMRLRNKWTAVDPRQWKTRTDMTVSVGLGTGNKDQMLGHLTTIYQIQKEALAIGLTTPKNIYAALSRLTQNAGFKNPEEFWTDPGDPPPQEHQGPPQPSPDTLVMAQTEIQKTQIKAQSDEKIAAQRAALDYRAKIEVAQLNQQTDTQQLMQKEAESQRDSENERIRMQVEAVLNQYASQVPAQETSQPQNDVLAMAIQGFAQALQSMNRPKMIVRDQSGRAVGVTPAE